MSANDPAFPSHVIIGTENGPTEVHSFGLTKREHIAAMAMQGWLANSDALALAKDFGHQINKPKTFVLAQASVAMADALLAELEKKQS